MKKLAIITIYDNLNFGNKLQNYAVQTYFQKMGFDTETLPYSEQYRMPVNISSISRKIVHFILRPTAYEKKRRKRLRLEIERKKYISTFSQKYLNLGMEQRYTKLCSDLKNQYDYFVAGSDQVWHCWRNGKKELNYFFLAFAEPFQRLTIAPSFGFNKFPWVYRETYRRCLSGFQYISIREEDGARLIKNLTGKEATVLLDPTMLIDISEWLKILRRPAQYIKDDYIFVYSIGGFCNKVKESINCLAKQMKAEVIDIMDMDSDYYIHTRPDEFLYWIYNSKLVITDSFHASVFSILFNKPFVVVERSDQKGMGGRLDTLLSKFALEDRRYEIQKRAFINERGSEREELLTTHYKDVPKILAAEKQKAAKFYQQCLCSGK